MLVTNIWTLCVPMLCRCVCVRACVACVLNVCDNVPDLDMTWPDLDVDMVKPSLA